MRLIVCDTGPLLHLQEAGLLELLQKSGKVYIPRMVDIEMNELYPLWRKHKPEWITIEPLLLAKRLKPEWFLTDDTEARIFASSLGIEVHGSLGIVLWSAAMGHMNYSESKKALERLSKTSLWISKDILSQAKKALETMFRES
jgi:predicted nucleic acid-binding protein